MDSGRVLSLYSDQSPGLEAQLWGSRHLRFNLVSEKATSSHVEMVGNGLHPFGLSAVLA